MSQESTDSRMPTASLVTGLISLLLPVLFSIPAIVLGHMARGKIKRSGGRIAGGGMALAGLITGYVTLVFGAMMMTGFCGTLAALSKARAVQSEIQAVGIEQAVDRYEMEYDSVPDVGSLTFNTTSPEGVMLIQCLLSDESKSPPLNPKELQLLMMAEAKGNKGGVVYGASGKATGIFDAFGNPFTVVLRAKKDTELVFSFGDSSITHDGVAAVYSAGKDGKIGTKDDAKSW